MKINTKTLRSQAFGTSLVFIAFLFLSVALFVIRGCETLPATIVINITADIAGMVVGYVLFVCCVIDAQKAGDMLDAFLLLIFVDFIAMFTDEIAWLVDGIPSLRFINILDNTLYYAVIPLVAFLYWRYVATVLKVKTPQNAPLQKLMVAGLITAFGVRVLNVFLGFYFYVDENGVYHRAAFYLLSFLYTGITVTLTIVMIIRERKRLEVYQAVSLILYVAMPLVVGILAMVTYGFSIICPIMMVVGLLIYCVLNVVQSRQQAVKESEAKLATKIQEDVIPRTFPAFPEKHEFDLYASMTPAREVGGDFYDFFLTDDDHLALLIADVSGKGVPAALFMMVAKTLLKNQTVSAKMEPAKILETVNDQLCEGNEAMIFVTVWLGILEISTGRFRCANAGHEYPILKRDGEPYQIFKEPHGRPMGIMEGSTYQDYEIMMHQGDRLFVYTDGVPEAMAADKSMYGIDRAVEALNRNPDASPQQTVESVRADVDAFVGEADQFDDLTMLALEYRGKNGLD